MTTQQTNWTEYTGSDEQIAEIWNNYNGFLLNTTDKILTKDNFSDSVSFVEYLKQGVTRFWLIPDDPLREMKVRQAQTGQPVWIKQKCNGNLLDYALGTTIPDWSIPDAEYYFAPFEKDIKFKEEV